MQAWRRSRILWVAVAIACAVALVVVFGFWVRDRDTLVSDSPDGAYRAIVRERMPRLSIDRNFRLYLVDRKTGAQRLIFTSDDQSTLINRERLIWNEDSSRIALIGDRYFTVPEANLPNGEIVFLVYDVVRQKLWCNTDAEDRKDYERMSAEEARAVFGKALDSNAP